MTVEQLIEKLQVFDLAMEVRHLDNYWQSYDTIEDVERMDSWTNPTIIDHRNEEIGPFVAIS
jgi:hypothetical protein